MKRHRPPLSCPGQAATRERCGAEPGPSGRATRCCMGPAPQRIAEGTLRSVRGRERIHLSARNSIAGAASRSRGMICPSFAVATAPRRRRGRREGRVPAGTRGPLCEAFALRKLHSGIQVKPNIRPSLRSGFTAYVVLSPGSDALLPPSPLRMADAVARLGRHITARLGAQTPGARTTRFCRTQAAPVVSAQGAAHGVTRPAATVAATQPSVHHVPPRMS
jgi:hypothetical protein